jgi:hypothetical protein
MITTFKIDCNCSADCVHCRLNTDFSSVITADWNVAFASSTQCYKFTNLEVPDTVGYFLSPSSFIRLLTSMFVHAVEVTELTNAICCVPWGLYSPILQTVCPFL